MKYYTFSTLDKDGLKWYPKSTKGGFQGNLISDWTNNKNEAIIWANSKDFDCLMNEYVDTEIEIVEKDSSYKKLITITNANNQNKFICFKIDGLKDGIMVGLYPKGDGLSIAYRGDVIGVPFDADSALIDELNDNSFPKPEDIVTGTITMSKETYDWLTTSGEDDDIGDWRENTVFTEEIDQEKVNACKEIFKDIDKIKIKCEGENIPNNEIHGFLQVIDECNLYNAEEYSLFISVINEHCIEKGIYDLETIKNTWFTFKRSLEDAAKNIDVRKKEFEKKIKNQGTDNV